MGSDEVNQFLTHLAAERHVSASTQNQALSALLFLDRKVLKIQLTFNAVRAKLPERLPVVLSQDEVRQILLQIPPKAQPCGAPERRGSTMLADNQKMHNGNDVRFLELFIRPGWG